MDTASRIPGPRCVTSTSRLTRSSCGSSCLAWSHVECWREHTSCAACGRKEQVDTRAPLPQALRGRGYLGVAYVDSDRAGGFESGAQQGRIARRVEKEAVPGEHEVNRALQSLGIADRLVPAEARAGLVGPAASRNRLDGLHPDPATRADTEQLSKIRSVVFVLHHRVVEGKQHRIGGGEGVEIEEAEARRAVDERVVVRDAAGLEGLLEARSEGPTGAGPPESATHGIFRRRRILPEPVS